MRKILFCFILFASSLVSVAQDITTMWPYIYPEFKTGTVFFNNKQTLSALVNIHLLKSTLHYLENDKIKEALTSDIVFVQIASDNYYMRDNHLMQVLAGDSSGFVAELVMADFAAVMETGGAYGSSSNVQAVRKLSSLEIGGINITNHMELRSQKEMGSLLPLIKKYFIVTTDMVFPANAKSIKSQLSEQKNIEFKQFLKKNRVNWKNPASLITVLNFLKD